MTDSLNSQTKIMSENSGASKTRDNRFLLLVAGQLSFIIAAISR